jgi:hypothetical protein
VVTIGEQTATRRENARLRAERWRRAHGIMPRKPASKPWLAMGVSRSTYYRRKARARQQAVQQAAFARADGFLRRLRCDVARAHICSREMGAIIAQLESA